VCASQSAHIQIHKYPRNLGFFLFFFGKQIPRFHVAREYFVFVQCEMFKEREKKENLQKNVQKETKDIEIKTKNFETERNETIGIKTNNRFLGK
jgi:hypothetical protein